MSRRRSLPIGLVILLLTHIALAEDDRDYAKLYNGKGQTPCELRNSIEACSSARASLSRRDPPVNQCTCNNVFWNLWGACVISQGNASSAEYSDDWNQKCQQNNVPVRIHNSSPDESWTAMDIPQWAYADLPSTNHTFDIGRALAVAGTGNGKWPTLHIVLPIVVGVAVAFICGIAFLIYRRKRRASMGKLSNTGSTTTFSTVDSLRRKLWNGLGTTKVKKGTRGSQWEIDSRDDESQFELVDRPDSPNSSPYGHVRLSSSPTQITFPDSPSGRKRGAEYTLPGKNLWKNPQWMQKMRRRWFLLPVPWRQRPVAVHSISPSNRFEIDTTNQSVKTAGSTLAKYRKGGFRTGNTESSVVGTDSLWEASNVHETIYEAEEDDDDLDGLLNLGRRGNEGDVGDDEHESLIPREPAVLIISRSGEDFSLESEDTNRLPPRPQTPPAQTRARGHSRAASAAILNTPPAPKYRAPLPPVSPPRLPEASSPAQNVRETSPFRSPTSPPSIPLPPEPRPLYARPSDPLPSLTDPSSNSNTENSRAPLPSSLPPPPPSPPRLPRFQPSFEQLMQGGSTTSSTPRLSQYSLLSPPYRSSPLPTEILIARAPSSSPPPHGQDALELYHEQQQSPPYSSSPDHPILVSPPLPPPAPPSSAPQSPPAPTARRRELPMTPMSPPQHQRVLSTEGGPPGSHTPDPSLAMLYPSAVRSAGYTSSESLLNGNPSISNNSRDTNRDPRWYPDPSSIG